MESATVILFQEKQKFTQVWLWVLLGIGWGIAMVPLYNQFHALGWGIFSSPSGLIAPVVLLLVIILFLTLQLTTVVTPEGITIHFSPFLKSEYFPKNEIATAEVITYSPLRDYGGWGIRYSFRNGKAYNVSGNKGARLLLKSGKKVMIGTKEPQALQKAIAQMLEG